MVIGTTQRALRAAVVYYKVIGTTQRASCCCVYYKGILRDLCSAIIEQAQERYIAVEKTAALCTAR